jgi:hypothetical protein
VFNDGNQNGATPPVSFKGFGTAFDALVKECAARFGFVPPEARRLSAA